MKGMWGSERQAYDSWARERILSWQVWPTFLYVFIFEKVGSSATWSVPMQHQINGWMVLWEIYIGRERHVTWGHGEERVPQNWAGCLRWGRLLKNHVIGFLLLLKLCKSKATGLDMISARLLRKSADLIANSLCSIFNRSINSGVFPDE